MHLLMKGKRLSISQSASVSPSSRTGRGKHSRSRSELEPLQMRSVSAHQQDEWERRSAVDRLDVLQEQRDKDHIARLLRHKIMRRIERKSERDAKYVG